MAPKKTRVGAAAGSIVAAARDVERVTEWSVLTALSLMMYAQLLLANAALLAIIMAIGGVLVLMRLAFFACIPFMLDHVHTFVDTINVFIVTFVSIETVVDALIAASEAVINGLDAVTFGLTGSVHQDSFYKHRDFDGISYAEFTDAIQLVQRECQPIDSVYAMINHAVPAATSPLLCPLLRAGYPLPGVPRLSRFLVWWSADPNPGVGGNNCFEPLGSGLTYAYLCDGIGVGYIVLEIILPILLISLFMVSSGRDLMNLLLYASKLCVHLLEAAAESVSIVVMTARQMLVAILTKGVKHQKQKEDPPPPYTQEATRIVF